jgi:hypothetical protein
VAEERDPLIERAVRDLSALPAMPHGATARILAAVAAQQDEGDSTEPARRVGRRYSLGALSGLAAAAAIAGFAIGFEWSGTRRTTSEVASSVSAPVADTPAPVRLATNGEDAPNVVPFMLRAPGASTVAIVGDFNGWDVSKSPMQQSAPGVWSTTIGLVPGRHIYAFVVDDSVWTLDPRAPRVADPDFGRSGSAIVVGAR